MPTYQQNSSFTPWTPGPPATAAIPQNNWAPPQPYTAGQGMYALADLKAKTEGIVLGWIGYKSGENYYRMHPDLLVATMRGLEAMRRWWIWIRFVTLWLFSLAMVLWIASIPEDISGFIGRYERNGLIFLPISLVLGVGVTYCRAVDFSLFRRRFVYRLLSPLVRGLTKVSNGWLYLTVFLPLFLPF